MPRLEEVRHSVGIKGAFLIKDMRKTKTHWNRCEVITGGVQTLVMSTSNFVALSHSDDFIVVLFITISLLEEYYLTINFFLCVFGSD